VPRLENTVPALLLAVEEGADLVEFDVQATADGVLVVHHDFRLGRLAGRPDLAVESATQAELAALELRHPEHPERAGRIPTLAELLAALPAGFPVNIELKVRRCPRGRLAELALAAAGGRENVLFSSFDSALLGELRRRSATAAVAPIARRWTPALERLGAALGAWSLHVAGGVARAEAAAAGLPAAPPLAVYTVNDAARARTLLAAGAAGLFTDRPGGLRAELGTPGDSGVVSETYRGTRAPRRSA
jgi:glycerophosphoryl diester phosphodiesterase